MVILFDLTATQPIGGAKRHGGGKYGEIILRRIIERKLPVVCYYDSQRWLNPEVRKIIKPDELVDINNHTLAQIVDKYGCNLIFSALPNSRELYSFDKCKVVGTIHGLRRLETPADPFIFKYKNQNWKSWIAFFLKYFAEKLYTKILCNYYKKEWFYPNFNFITVSNHTACSFKTYFPELRDKEVPVFYSPSTSPQIELKRVYAQRYFMLVSGNRVEKNNLRAIMALDKLFSVGYLLDFTVKIAGAKDASIYSYKIKNTCKFEFLGYVDDSLLEQLYHDAYCLVYPSLNEGFGYPPLEAMHYGVPVIASPFASIPEVCEDSALYFNPFSIEEIAARILRILDPGVHSIYSKKAYAQYQKITAIQNNDLDALIDYLYQNK